MTARGCLILLLWAAPDATAAARGSAAPIPSASARLTPSGKVAALPRSFAAGGLRIARLSSALPAAAATPMASASAAARRTLAITDRGLLQASDVEGALERLRRASYPRTPDSDRLIELLAGHHPHLPLRADRVFLVRDRAVFESLGLPSGAAGAARILTDGRRSEKVVILNAIKPIALDDFVEFVVHEAVHLSDEGILRVPHGAEVLHWFAEGYTQLRSHAMANASLIELGRPSREGWQAYSDEVALVQAFIAEHGAAALDVLVREGDAAPLRSALGPRWEFVEALGRLHIQSPRATRERLVGVFKAVVERPEFRRSDFEDLSRYFRSAD